MSADLGDVSAFMSRSVHVRDGGRTGTVVGIPLRQACLHTDVAHHAAQAVDAHGTVDVPGRGELPALFLRSLPQRRLRWMKKSHVLAEARHWTTARPGPL